MGDKHDEDEEGAMTGFTGWHCGECWGGQDKDIQQICSQSCVAPSSLWDASDW